TLRRRRSRGPAEIPPGAVRAGSAFDPEQDAALPHDLFGFLQVVFGPRLPANPVDVLGDVFLDRDGRLPGLRPVLGKGAQALSFAAGKHDSVHSAEPPGAPPPLFAVRPPR